MTDGGSSLQDEAGTFAAYRPHCPRRIEAEHVEHVSEVEADGAHAQVHLGATKWWEGGQRLEEEVADGTARVEVQMHEAVQGRGRRREARCARLVLL